MLTHVILGRWFHGVGDDELSSFFARALLLLFCSPFAFGSAFLRCLFFLLLLRLCFTLALVLQLVGLVPAHAGTIAMLRGRGGAGFWRGAFAAKAREFV